MKKAVLFDLGNTLVQYYGREDIPLVLERAMEQLDRFLRDRGLPAPGAKAILHAFEAENHESPDLRVRPLALRLARVVGEDLARPELNDGMCRAFLSPIFAMACVYADTLPTLADLRKLGVRTAIVSNTPWGSPGHLWREHLADLGLDRAVDVAVFCTDAGYRKPARPIFDLALSQLGMKVDDCLFVGDDPRWDTAGARAIGMHAVLIARSSASVPLGETPIRDLSQLRELLSRCDLVHLDSY
jgi:HAD superfamily hydrolase (TIGR01509 family)